MKKLIGFSLTVFIVFAVVLTEGGLRETQAQTYPALKAPENSAGYVHNTEAIKYYKKSDWKEAEKHFWKAVNADKDLAEAHYNLALTLDKLGRHSMASDEFKRALDLAPKNWAIANSKILKLHLGN